MQRVKFNVNTEYAYIQNFKVLQSQYFLPSTDTTRRIPSSPYLHHESSCQ